MEKAARVRRAVLEEALGQADPAPMVRALRAAVARAAEAVTADPVAGVLEATRWASPMSEPSRTESEGRSLSARRESVGSPVPAAPRPDEVRAVGRPKSSSSEAAEPIRKGGPRHLRSRFLAKDASALVFPPTEPIRDGEPWHLRRRFFAENAASWHLDPTEPMEGGAVRRSASVEWTRNAGRRGLVGSQPARRWRAAPVGIARADAKRRAVGPRRESTDLEVAGDGGFECVGGRKAATGGSSDRFDEVGAGRGRVR